MSIHQEIHALIDQLGAEEAEETLDYIRWLLAGDDTLTEAELELVKAGEAQIARGEYETLADFRRSLEE
jgi:hypothetical protein